MMRSHQVPCPPSECHMDQEEEYHQDQMLDPLSPSLQSQVQCLHLTMWLVDQEEEETQNHQDQMRDILSSSILTLVSCLDQEEEFPRDQMLDLLSSSPQSQVRCPDLTTRPVDQEEEMKHHQEGQEPTFLLFLVQLPVMFHLLPDLFPTDTPCTPLSMMAECEWILKESGRGE